MTILLAAPALPPQVVAAEAQWTRCRHVWTGWNGSVFDLSRPSGGVFLMPGVQGLGMPPGQIFASESAGIPGRRYRGERTSPREVFWPLYLYSDDGAEKWRELDARFARTLRRDQLGTWTVTDQRGAFRSLRLRFVDDGSHTSDVDPAYLGWARYGLTFVADQPFWEGEPVVRSWRTEAPSSFFGAGAPPFTISSGSTLSTAAIDNPGDEPAYPVWTLEGPFESAAVGVAGRLISIPFGLPAGKSLTIDPRPSAQTAIDSDGVERTADLGAVNFAAVPPGQQVALSLSLVGTGTVSVSLTPLWLRAW